MISTISNVKKSNSVNNNAKDNFCNLQCINKSNQLVDRFTDSKQSSQIAFTANPLNFIKREGNLAKSGKNLFGEGGAKLGGKVKSFADEATKAISVAVRKLTGKDELPVVKIPIVAQYDTFDNSALKAAKEALKNATGDQKEALAKAIKHAETFKDSSGNYSAAGLTDIKDATKNATGPSSLYDPYINNCSPHTTGGSSSLSEHGTGGGYDAPEVDGGDFDCDLDLLDSLSS